MTYKTTKSTNLVFQEIPIKDLKPNPNNPRKHSPAQIKMLCKSIQKFGFVSPVVCDENNVLLTGNGRIEAARLAGLKMVPAILATHLNEYEKRAFIIADNRLSDKAEWDDTILKSELLFLTNLKLTGEFDLDFSAIGFEIPEIDIFLATKPDIVSDLATDQVGQLLSEGVPKRAKPGDLFALGDHRLLCGNSLEPENTKKLMGQIKAQLLCTDPPYNVPIAGHVSGQGHREFSHASGEMSFDEFRNFLTTIIKTAQTILDDGSLSYVFMDWRHDRELQAAAEICGLKQLNLVIWDKGVGGMGSHYRSQHELIYVYLHGKKQKHNNIMLGKWGRNRTNVWQYPSANMSKEGREALKSHPTPKPVRMIADLYLDCTEIGDVVFDPFIGSGTAILAAEETKRKCYGIEIDPQYVDVSIARWEAMTGKKAELLKTTKDQTNKRIRHR